MLQRTVSAGRLLVLSLTLACLVILASSIAPAQETAPKFDVFAGYSWLHPGGNVAGPVKVNPLSASPTIKFPELNKGFGLSGTYNIYKWLGFTGEFGHHQDDNNSAQTIMVGPKFTYRTENFSPFAEALIGTARLAPQFVDSHYGFGAAVGGGIDLFFTPRIAWRVIQADYLYQAHPANKIGGDGTFNGARLQGGIVFGFGSLKPPVAPTAACSVQPTAVLAGEPINATVSTQNFNPKHTLKYEWKATGGKVEPKETAASIDTTGLNPGSYTVTATVNDPKGPKNYQTATCNASFTINEPPKHPPVVSCSANPATVKSGDSSTITCEGSSPDSRPLTYSCTPTAGRISGSGPTFTLDTAGASAGPITVNCTTTDDRGLNASSSTSVNVEVPPPPPQASKIGEIVFPNAKKPWRVDNTAKAILDDVALRLQREPDAKAVVVGYFDPAEKGGAKLAEQRAVNTKAYLTDEKGIDPNRIEVRTGTAGGNRAEIYLVPQGATFSAEGTQTFDESTVKKAEEKKPVKKAPAKRVRKAPKP